MRLITTSWDDGSVFDFKLADLLVKYNLPATFYIPKSNPERAVIGSEAIKRLSRSFEIGGHGLHHLRLNSTDTSFLQHEINGSYNWLSDLLGTAPSCFCFPGGKFSRQAADTVFTAGYQLARTTELFTTSLSNDQPIVATTLQAYPHSKFTYAKHLIKRKRRTTFLSWVKNKMDTDLIKLAAYYLATINEKGGCFHLWGHSWEIEKYNLWPQLEDLFKLISHRPEFSYVDNKELIMQPALNYINSLSTAAKKH